MNYGVQCAGTYVSNQLYQVWERSRQVSKPFSTQHCNNFCHFKLKGPMKEIATDQKKQWWVAASLHQFYRTISYIFPGLEN